MKRLRPLAYRRLANGRVRLLRGPSSAYIHADEDGFVSATADHVIDDPRQPRIEQTGVLDERGQMLCRVTVPIKVKMGFHIPGQEPVDEEVCSIVPEDMLQVSDCGVGLGHVTTEELEEEDEQ